jgi:HrpA-like RNA helicase
MKKPFYYAIEINDGIILTEELYKSGLGKQNDELIFERKTVQDKKTFIKFSEKFESNPENLVLKKVIEKNLSKPNKPIFKLLTTLENPFLAEIETAFNWFENTLQIIKPEEKPIALAHQIDTDKAFKKYAQDIMLSFNTGIYDIKSESKTLKEFFGQDNATELDSLLKRLEDSPQKMIRFNNIFTTPESNLLDQNIFRLDEIWFVEKDKNGCTDIYPLSDFKEHNITDIKKGYLNGRYGSIPFLANLKDLNWHQYDSEE